MARALWLILLLSGCSATVAPDLTVHSGRDVNRQRLEELAAEMQRLRAEMDALRLEQRYTK